MREEGGMVKEGDREGTRQLKKAKKVWGRLYRHREGKACGIGATQQPQARREAGWQPGMAGEGIPVPSSSSQSKGR